MTVESKPEATNFVLEVRSVPEMELLFGTSEKTTASGFAVQNGELWRYCLDTKTRWDTGWRYDAENDFAGFPKGVESFRTIERPPAA